MKKHFFYFLIIFLSAFVAVGCSDDDEIVETTLDDINMVFDKAKKTQEIEIPIDGVSNDWDIYSPSEAGWLNFERIPGRKMIRVDVGINDTQKERTSYVMIRSKGQNQRINVVQDGDATIKLAANNIALSYLSNVSNIEITNVDEFTDFNIIVEESDRNWLTVVKEGGVLLITTQRNTTEDQRESIVTITAKQAMLGIERTTYLNIIQGKGAIPYVFDIPDFSQSSVYKVMYNGKQVAQIAKEYLKLKDVVNSQAIVVYPVTDDEVELDRGYVAQIVLENTDLADATFIYAAPSDAVHGGNISFDATSNAITSYVKGTYSTPITRVYMPGNIGMGPIEVPNSLEASVVPHLIEDVRGTEENTYPIVKIGTQYWMGKHLVTGHYNSNKNFAAIPTNITGNDRSLPNYCIYNYHDGKSQDATALINKERYGYLYSYLAIGGFNSAEDAGTTTDKANIEDNISPEGWIVPAHADLSKLKDYLTVFSKLRKFIDYSTGDQIYRRIDDNITGFAAPNSSYRNSDGYYAFGYENGCWMHSRSCTTAISSYMFHMNSVLTGQGNYRLFSIRSVNNGFIKIKPIETK